jgi:hypothetical protein
MTNWKNIPKTKIGELLGVHRNTVQHLIAKGDLGGVTMPDVAAFLYRKGIEDGRSESRLQMNSAMDVLEKK